MLRRRNFTSVRLPEGVDKDGGGSVLQDGHFDREAVEGGDKEGRDEDRGVSKPHQSAAARWSRKVKASYG